MGIITLTTDLGHKDFYQAALKGSILSLYPSAKLVDISHHIEPYNIQQAAFTLRHAYSFFPAKTVHLVGIDTVFNVRTRYVAVRYKQYYFVGADNGIFSLIFDEAPDEIVELNLVQDLKFLHFPLTDILAKAACSLAKGGKLSDIGDPIDTIEERTMIQPLVKPSSIRGSVVYVDSFENAITNIDKELFTQVQANRSFTVNFRRNESIKSLSWHYNEVPEGEKLCLFGITNYLEIAINKGKACSLLGLQVGETVHIEFEE